MRTKVFYVLFIIVCLLGVFLRFYDITSRPIHHDEGVIGWFELNIYGACMDNGVPDLSYGAYKKACSPGSTGLYCTLGYPLGALYLFSNVCGSSYSYNPDYHGPFEYLIGAWIFAVFGISDYTLRAPGALFNIACVLLLIPLRKKLGDTGVLLSAALIAVSPSMVYYAQRAYMDNYLIFFMLATVVCAVKFSEERKNIWLYLCIVNLAVLFTIKELAFIFTVTAFSFLFLSSMIKFGQSVRQKKRIIFNMPRQQAFRALKTFVLAALVFFFVYAFFIRLCSRISATSGKV